MDRLLSSRSSVEADPTQPTQVIDVDGDAADKVFNVLSSKTARQTLAAIYEDPKPASELADAADTSLQNTHYHLDNLRDADLIEVVDTVYSEQGNDMKIYGPTNGSLVVFAGDDETKSSLRGFLQQIIPVVSVLAVMSFVVEQLASQAASSSGISSPLSVPNYPLNADAGHQAVVGTLLSPGLLFFAGGLFVLLLVLAWSQHAQ